MVIQLITNIPGNVVTKGLVDPPPGGGWSFLVNFPVKFFFFIFLMENGSIMPETDFKQKKIFF